MNIFVAIDGYCVYSS